MLTAAQLQHKREHKAVLRRRKHDLIKYIRANYELVEDYTDTLEVTPSPAPPAVTGEKKSTGFLGFLSKQASRIWNRKV